MTLERKRTDGLQECKIRALATAMSREHVACRSWNNDTQSLPSSRGTTKEVLSKDALDSCFKGQAIRTSVILPLHILHEQVFFKS